MAHSIKSKKSPFANLANLIVKREHLKLLSLLYPQLSTFNKHSTLDFNPNHNR